MRRKKIKNIGRKKIMRKSFFEKEKRKKNIIKNNNKNESLLNYINNNIKKLQIKDVDEFVTLFQKEKKKRGRIGVIENPVKLTVYIPKEINEQLRWLINHKYDEYRSGALSLEVTEALRYWLSLHHIGGSFVSKHKNAQKINPPSKVFKVASKLREWYINVFGYTPRETTIYDLKKAISEIRGHDERTISKWLELLEKYHFIKHIVGFVYELNLP